MNYLPALSSDFDVDALLTRDVRGCASCSVDCVSLSSRQELFGVGLLSIQASCGDFLRVECGVHLLFGVVPGAVHCRLLAHPLLLRDEVVD